MKSVQSLVLVPFVLVISLFAVACEEAPPEIDVDCNCTSNGGENGNDDDNDNDNDDDNDSNADDDDDNDDNDGEYTCVYEYCDQMSVCTGDEISDEECREDYLDLCLYNKPEYNTCVCDCVEEFGGFGFFECLDDISCEFNCWLDICWW